MTSRAAAFANYQRDIYLFSRDVVGLPLYAYQAGWAQHILEVASSRRNETVVVEMARQSGKNQGQAMLMALLLARFAKSDQSGLIATAPTFKPQIINSRQRLMSIAERVKARLPWLKYKSSMGYIYLCGRARVDFLSAEPTANVVGATASLLMIADEMQDIDRSTFDKKFTPMRASTNAPLACFGTAWTEDTLLYQTKQDVQEGRVKGAYFRVLPDEIALANPAYGEFVDTETKRLGRDHPLIKTQYYLEELASGGRMLKRQQVALMHGTHDRAERRTNERQIVAGLDFAGADEEAGGLVSLSTASARDSVALTIGAVEWLTIVAGVIVPHIRIVARYEWINVNPVALHATLYEILWGRWKVNRCHADNTGIGATSTAFLAAALNKDGVERIAGQTFDGAWATHTRIAFNYLAAVNGTHVLDYRQNFDILDVAYKEQADPEDVDKRAWWQRAHARLQGKPGQKVKASVPESEGHDDLLISEMLMVDAAYAAGVPQGRKKAKSREY
jgi:hypothetical protein